MRGKYTDIDSDYNNILQQFLLDPEAYWFFDEYNFDFLNHATNGVAQHHLDYNCESYGLDNYEDAFVQMIGEIMTLLALGYNEGAKSYFNMFIEYFELDRNLLENVFKVFLKVGKQDIEDGFKHFKKMQEDE